MEQISRRKILASMAAGAAVSLAGCIDSGPQGLVEGDPDGDGTGGSDEPTGFGPQSTTDDTNTTDENTSDGSTDGAEYTMSAQQAVQDAVDLYGEQAGVGGTLIDVTVDTSFSHTAVRQSTRDATDAIADAREAGETTEETLVALEAAVEWVDYAAVAQRHLSDAYGTLDAGLASIYAKRPEDVDQTGLSDQLSGAADSLASLGGVDTSSFDLVDALSESMAGNKHSQLQMGLDSLSVFDTHMADIVDVLTTFYKGVDMYYGGQREESVHEFDYTRENGEPLADAFTPGEVGATALSDQANGLDCHLSAVPQASEALRKARIRDRYDETEKRDSLEQDAQDALDSCARSVTLE